jgi:hypothetical protein
MIVLGKERPVRLRAYQAGLWGCLTNPGRVGGLVGSAYDFSCSCLSSYNYQNLKNSEPCRQEPGNVRPGAFLTGLTRGAFSACSPSPFPPGASSGHRRWPFSLASRRWPPHAGGGTDRIPELVSLWPLGGPVSSSSHVQPTPPLQVCQGKGSSTAFLLQMC